MFWLPDVLFHISQVFGNGPQGSGSQFNDKTLCIYTFKLLQILAADQVLWWLALYYHVTDKFLVLLQIDWLCFSKLFWEICFVSQYYEYEEKTTLIPDSIKPRLCWSERVFPSAMAYLAQFSRLNALHCANPSPGNVGWSLENRTTVKEEINLV